MIEWREWSVEEQIGKTLVCLDSYLERKKDNAKKRTFVYSENYDLYFLENDEKTRSL